jgi:hypothetical protein
LSTLEQPNPAEWTVKLNGNVWILLVKFLRTW